MGPDKSRSKHQRETLIRSVSPGTLFNLSESYISEREGKKGRRKGGRERGKEGGGGGKGGSGEGGREQGKEKKLQEMLPGREDVLTYLYSQWPTQQIFVEHLLCTTHLITIE